MDLMSWISLFVAVIGGIIGVVFATGKFYEYLKNSVVTKKELADLKKGMSDIITKKELYKEDGGLIYMPASDVKEIVEGLKNACLQHREGCSALVCDKIDKIEKGMADLKNDSRTYQDEVNKSMLKISGHMGKVNEFIDQEKSRRAVTGG